VNVAGGRECIPKGAEVYIKYLLEDTAPVSLTPMMVSADMVVLVLSEVSPKEG
jgi:hypothetical protein